MKRLSHVAVAALFAACGGHKTEKPPAPVPDRAIVQSKDVPDGIDLRVSNGKQGAPAFDHATLAPATKLGDAEVQQLLARSKPLAVDPADLQAFALRPASQPPPRTGDTIKSSFPPPASSLLPPTASDASKALQVLRYMPEGDVPIAPQLSVTFSQPMVPVTSQSDAAAVTPVKLTPPTKGKWRWIGTRTIVFDPDVRFPQATTYQVEIPAGTKGMEGPPLAKTVAFKFETPPPTMVEHSPNEYPPQRLDAPMFVMFDQKIDPQAVLQSIHLTAASGWDSGKPHAVRMLDAAEIAKDKQLAAMVDAANKDEQAGRWLAFRAVEPLPADAQIMVDIPIGTPSAEGPNKTKTVQAFSFHTYPPLRIDEATCGYGDVCRPGMAFDIRFDNPLDVDKFDEAQVSVTPAIPGMKVIQNGNTVAIIGATKARATYMVNVSGKIIDEFGQRLGKDTPETFSVGDASPTFFGPDGMVVLDPAAKQPTLDFFSTNYDQLKVKLFHVEPDDLGAFGNYLDNQWNHDHPPRMPGTKVFDALVKTGGAKNELVETAIDLAPAIRHGFGHAIAIVEPSPWKESYPPPRMIAWVQSTKLAVDAYVDNDSLIAFATDLATGKPAGGVELEIHPFGIKATTADNGMATLPLSAAAAKGPHFLVAKRGDDVAFVAESWSSYGNWVKQTIAPQLAWYVFDDRQMYKPGEDVTLKGWLRMIDYGKNGDVGGLAGNVTAVTYRVIDETGNQIGAGTAPVSAVGGFDTKFTLPKTPNLGYASIIFAAQGRTTGSFTHGIQIQEFRRPEFEVAAHASQGPFLVGGDGDVTVDAKYFSGGPLPGAPVNWYVTASQTSFTPPNRDDYIFGSWQPWWGRASYRDDESDFGLRYHPPKTWNLKSKTDATGAHVLHMDFLSVKPAVPMSVTATANVTDVNHQMWSSSAALIVHPSSLYVGIKTKKPFVEQGKPFDVDVIGVDLDGKAAVGAKIDIKAVRLDSTYKKGHYVVTEVDPQTCAVVAATEPVPCELPTKQGGTYQLTATITDAQGRPNQTKLEFWVSGGEQTPTREVAQERVQLIPDKKEYAAGDTAELLVQSPFSPAEGVVSWRRSGIVKTARISFDGPTKVITVPITDGMVPNMIVQVDVVGMEARTDDHGDPDPNLPKRPSYAVGQLSLSVPPKQRTLHVTVAPNAAKIGPGESAKLAIDVQDASGKPVADAEVAVVVVDEAILSLTGYQFANPIETFYPGRDGGARDFYLRSYLKLAKPDAKERGVFDYRRRGYGPGGGFAMTEMPDAAPASGVAMALDEGKMGKDDSDRAEGQYKMSSNREPAAKSRADAIDLARNAGILGGLKGESGRPQPAIAIRSNFNPLAAFAPSVKTGADGKAVVDIKLPDNLTRYRIVAIAVAGDKQFGKGESAITARLPLMVRPSPPRFLNFGDTFRLPVVIQNQTDSPMTVKVAIRSTNATITDGAGREVSVPANDRVEVEFPAAAEMAGTARFQIVGTAGDAPSVSGAGGAASAAPRAEYNDAAEVSLPVWTPATTEAFATYGVIDDGAIKQPVALPGNVVTQFGGLEITTASTNLQALTDAMLYLVHYPFECAEQRSSRILAIAALRDVLTAFKTKDMPSKAAMETSVAVDIEHLSQMQNNDGGFAFWDRGYASEPYLSVFVVNALVHAKAKGFAVPAELLAKAKPYLQAIEDHYPTDYPREVRWAISAYALYTRKQMGDVDIAKGLRLYKEAGLEHMSMETAGWLLGLFTGNASALAERKEIVRYAMNHVSGTAGAANFTNSYGDGNYLILGSDRRVDGVMLESLIQEQKDSDLIPKIVTGLLAHRTAGRWENTQENAFVLLALDLYFQTYEKVTPDFVARVWLGNDYAGDHTFKGRSTEYAQIDVPMKDVATHDKSDLTIQKDGKGRLYYRIGMKYAPASLSLEPADYGFVVERRYEAIDDPHDVTHASDGTWHIKTGARVRIKLTMVNQNRRYHVALVDPMPAGLEAMNPALAVTGPIPVDADNQKLRGRYWWWYGPWYEHQNMRDERVEAFTSLLWEGVHAYDYVARATTPGNFIVPPPKAEEMYMPETFGRGASDRVIVE